jgi:crotonobetaine/carnitine-CoA ligase
LTARPQSPPGASLIEVLSIQAGVDAARSFITEADRPAITYGEAFRLVGRWADAFRRLGVRPGDRVLIGVPTSLESIFSWLGCAAAGGLAVPIDPRLIGRPLEHVIALADARVMVVGPATLERLVTVSERVRLPPSLVVPGGTPQTVPRTSSMTLSAFLAAADDVDPPVPRARDAAALIFTSGTTGPPKLPVMHWAQLHAIGARCAPPGSLDEDDVIYAPFPDFHHSSKMLTFAAALAGGRIVVRHRFSRSDFWTDVRTHGVTVTMMIAGMPTILMSEPAHPSDREHTLRKVLMSPVIANVEAFRQRFGVAVATSYGMTEISVPLGSERWDVLPAGSCGTPRPGYPEYELRIVDDDDLEVARGQTGELVVRTRSPWTISTEYFGMPAETAKAWRNGWFHTGDAFRVDEHGHYQLVDRIKDCIRRRGENLSSYEIERVVLEHPDVRECAAVAVPAELGDDDIKVVLSVRLGVELTGPSLVQFLRSRLPEFMLPRYVEVVDELPKVGSTHKIQKASLRSDACNERTWDRLTTP